MEIEVNEENFEKEVIEKSKEIPVVVDFWAGWCGPCKMLGPVMEKLAKEYDGRFILAKLDVQANQSMAQKYGVRSIPCVKFFKNSKEVDEFIGYLNESDIRGWLDKNI
ncbi:MAG: thioredoxin [Nanoarchaeota archaeon]|nr:thioredoxin [Nanoarchaeota archaeon]MBU1005724.1 thioredoxin [Nanoarchaeota archaeon]MBU1945591.1 thioredoxin [Nanoarchaeota archaeon]